MKKFLSAVLVLVAVFMMASCEEKHEHSFGTDWVYDETHHWHECTCGEKSELIEHSFGATYQKNAEGHWQVCECGKTTAVEAHTWGEGEVVTPAGEENAGIMKYTCTVCGQTKQEVIPATGHNYGTWIEEVPPTCTAEGTLGHYHCATCQKNYDKDYNVLESLTIPIIDHSLVLVPAKAPTCTEDGNIAHYVCEVCGIKYNLFGETEIVLEANKGWDDSLAPYCTEDSGNDLHIINVGGTNAALKFKTVHVWPQFNQIKKLVPGSLNVVGATYRLLIDVKLGSNPLVPTSKLDIHYFFPTAGGFNKVIISDGRQLQNVGSVNSDDWTTLEYEYTIADGAKQDWANITFIYWCEGVLDDDNYILVDNIRIVAADDSTNTNLDTIGNGDFDNYFEKVVIEDVTIPAGHQYGELIPEKAPTCTEPGLKAHYKCSACNLYFDEDKVEVTYDDLVIPASGDSHNLGALVPEVAATCTESGLKAHYKCSLCNSYFDQDQAAVEYSELVIPALGHDLTLVPYKAPTCTEDGNISYLECENCHTKYAYGDTSITLQANQGWGDSLAPYCTEDSSNDFFIVNDGGVNAALKIKTVQVWPKFNQIKKLVPGSLNVVGATYRLLIDVKLGANPALPTSKLDIQYYYPIAGGLGRVIISDGRQLQNVGAVNSTGWTTLEYEFTIGENALTDWANITFIYWCEGALDDDNYILVDNIRVVAIDDLTNTNLDTIGNGDFENYLEKVEVVDVAIPAGHKYGELIPEKAPTCTEPGLRAHYKCSVCNLYFDEDKVEIAYDNLVIPASGDSHNLGVLIPEVAATCTESGLKAHYKCSVCNSYFDQDKVAVEYSALVIPALGHDLTLVPYKAPTCTEDGNISYYHCSTCSKKFIYDGNNLTMATGGTRFGPYSNWGGDPLYIIGENGNAFLKIQASGWPTWTQLDKDLSSNLLTSGEYTIMFDVKLSEAAYYGVNGSGNKGSIHIRLNYEGASDHYISNVNNNISLCNMDNFTTLSYDYSITGLESKPWVSVTFIYWIEGSNVDNYILIDNIRVIAKGDSTQINLDTTSNYGFEGLMELVTTDNVTIPAGHSYGELIPEQPATCTEPGLRAHYKCSVCNLYFDEDKVEVAYEDLVIPASGDNHTYGVLVPEQPATCTESGLRAHYKCSVCNSYFDEDKAAVEYSALVIPALGHDLTLVPYKAPTTEEDGYISHFDCTRCGMDFVYDPAAVYTINGNSQWANYPIGNFNAGNTYIVGQGTNAAFKFAPSAWGEFNSLTKDTGPSLAKPGTYVLSFDLKGGTNIDAVKAGKLDIQFNYEIPGNPAGNIIISDGVFNLGGISNTGWTTVTYEFTVPEVDGGWSNFVFYYWPEVSLEGNYLLMDNFMVYVKGDDTKTNLDTLGRGDFEGFLKQYVILEEEDKIIPKLT